MSFKSLLKWNLEHRWIVLGFFILVTVLAATQVLKLRFEFSPEAMLEFSQEENDYQKAFNVKFSSNPNLFLLVMASENSLVNEQSLADLRDLTTLIESVDGISGTYSLARVPDNSQAGAGALIKGTLNPLVPAEGKLTPEQVAVVKNNIESSGLLRGNLISEDGRYALIMAPIEASAAEPNEFYTVYEHIDKTVHEWQAAGHDGYDISYGGVPYIRAVIVKTMKTEQFKLWPVVGILYIIALCFVFKPFAKSGVQLVSQAVLPLICIACVIVWAIAIMVLCDMPVTMINNTLPLLILVIGVTNGIYVLMRMIDERRKGKEKMRAILDGVYRVALATFLTTLTTSIGFGSLLTAKTAILVGFGGITSLAVMLIYVAIIFMMPQVASLIPLEVNEESKTENAKKQVETEVQKSEVAENKTETADGEQGHSEQPDLHENSGLHTPKDGWIEQGVTWLTQFNMAHPKLVILGAVILLGVSVFLAAQVRFDSRVNDVFMEDHPIAITNHIIEKELGGMLPIEVDVWADETGFFRNADNLEKFCALQKDIQKHEGVISSISLCNMLAEAGIVWENDNKPSQMQLNATLMGIRRLQPNMVKSYMTDSGNDLHITVRIPDDGYEHAKKIIADIKGMAAARFADTPVKFRLTGIGYNSTLGLDHFMTDLFTSLMTAFIIIFAILFISFRSVWSGMVAVLPNLLPICMTLAFLPLYGFNLNTTSVLVFTISIGLSVDNSIHVIQRYRQEYRGDRSVKDALLLAMRSSGRAILQSNILLCAGLATLLFSTFDPVKRVGALTMTTIAVALVASIIILPAEIVLVGHKMRLPRFKNEK